MRIVVVGIGNAFRGDDAVGLEVAERVRAQAPERVDVVTSQLEPTRLLDAWESADAVVIVDAVSSGAEPGTLHRFDAAERLVPSAVFRSSTHAFSIGETVELARALGRLPARALVYGIEAAGFVAGEEISPAVRAAVEPAAEAILRDVAVLLEEAGCTSAP
jgi:hydrogenase maturation protease